MRSNVFRNLVFLTIVIGVFSPRSTSAQSIAEPGTWTATPFLNGSFGTNAPSSSLGIGAGIAYDFTANLGFEGEFGHQFDVAGDDDTVDWAVTTFTANAVYHFDVINVTPYATAGLGFERSSIDVKVADPVALTIPSSTEVVWNFGGGVKYRLSDRMLARADLRRFQANDSAPDFWRLYGGLTFWITR